MSNEKERSHNPLRFIARFKRSLRKRNLLDKYGQEWNAESNGFQKRRYNSYEAYLEHQKAKLETHDFGSYDARFRQALRERLGAIDFTWAGRTVLCLGARIGTEVKAFLDLECFAVGIDLNPGKENRHVLLGDFHDLQFPASSVDIVYTNSLDHVFDGDRLAREVARVLKSNGVFIVEAVNGTTAGVMPGFFESFFWKEIGDLVGMFERAGFILIRRSVISFPWPGESIWFSPTSKA